jgi:hypothetical protein
MTTLHHEGKLMLSIHKHRFRVIVLTAYAATMLVASTPVAHAGRYDDRGYEERHRGYNDEYIFAATRGVTDMDAPPYLKVPLIPLTVVLDVAILPFEVIAGLF